jgi:hypothetical protein
MTPDYDDLERKARDNRLDRADPAVVLALIAERKRFRAALETISIPEGSADKVVLLHILERLKFTAKRALEEPSR